MKKRDWKQHYHKIQDAIDDRDHDQPYKINKRPMNDMSGDEGAYL